MSRLGKQPIALPDKVKVTISGTTVSAEGPAGKASVVVPETITVKLEEGKRLEVHSPSSTKMEKSLWGTWRSHLANLVEGVEKGYERVLEITGVGYNAKLQGTKLTLALGFSHQVELEVPAGLKVECISPVVISVKGVNKQLVGEFSAQIRAKRPAEPYNLKGIKYRHEVVRRKAGKTFVTGAS